MGIAVSSEIRAQRIPLPTRGGDLAALELGPRGQAIDIVFLHANGFNARTYRTILEPLAGTLRILVPDLRGHGRSELPLEMEGRTGWGDIRDDLLALLEVLDARDVVLSGHSMGGSAALLAAAEAAARVRALVLFEPVILKPEAIAEAMRGERLHGPMIERAKKRRAVFPDLASAYAAYHGRSGFKTWSDAMLQDYVADGFLPSAKGGFELACSPAWEASSYAAQGNDVWGALRRTRCPIQVLKAEHASTCALDEQTAAEIGPGRIQVQSVPGASHFLPMERPDLVQAALKAAAAR